MDIPVRISATDEKSSILYFPLSEQNGPTLEQAEELYSVALILLHNSYQVQFPLKELEKRITSPTVVKSNWRQNFAG